MAELGTTNIKIDRISDLVDRSAKNHQLKCLFFYSSKLSDSVFQVPIVSMALTISATLFQNDKKIDYLTDIIQSLASSVRTLQGNTGIPPIISQPRSQLTNISSESRIRTDYQRATFNKNRPEGANKCMYCWETDHHLKRHCQVF